MKKLFGFVKANGTQSARMVRVETSGQMPREDLQRQLKALAARKRRVVGGAHTRRAEARDEQPPSRCAA